MRAAAAIALLGIALTTAAPASAYQDPHGDAPVGADGHSAGQDRAPATPTGHQVWPDRGCAPTAPGTHLNPALLNDAQRLVFTATLAGDALTAEFAHWPVADPPARETLRWPADANGRVVAQADDWLFPQDGTHAWTVRALDATSASPETAPCYFTIDRTAPSSPTVHSEVYPSGKKGGGYGVPGDFTFSTTSDDVVAYEYRFFGQENWSRVAPAAPAGPVTITYTPPIPTHTGVAVRTVDRADNRSADMWYSFEVLEDRPFVWSDRYNVQGSPTGGVGVPGRFDFSSWVTDVVSYTFRVDDGPETTAAADAERKASVMYAPTHTGLNELRVRSTSSTGVSSPERLYRFVLNDAPVVTQRGSTIVGSSVEFALQPRQAGAVSYTYWFVRPDGTAAAQGTVPAAADGTARFTWAPLATDLDRRSLRVRSTDGSGRVSVTGGVSLWVDGAAPSIAIAGASPNRPATFTFTTTMVAPVEYEYWFDHEPSVKHTAPADPDGTTTVRHTADRLGALVLRARVRTADGTWSAQGSADWSVSDNPTVVSPEFPAGSSGPEREGSFTFTTNQAGATAFEYTVDGVTTTVPVGPDGTATIRWTPAHSGDQHLRVLSRTAAGVPSTHTDHRFRFAPTHVGRGQVPEWQVPTRRR
ncbi:hypothetical protein [Saccharothrix stipae]